MPVPVKKAAAAPVAADGVNFGSLSQYAGGFTLPEGDYAMFFNVVMHQATDKNNQPKGSARLGVMVEAHPLSGGEKHDQFYSMGSKAAESFAPGADGKSVVAVPGGAGGVLNNKTNWFMFLKSLYDCGLPEGILSNDFTVIDGVHVHTTNVPEPEDRKGFGAATGEVAEERRSGLVAVVSEIKEDGKPWEGTGGMPDASAAPAKPGPKAAAKPAAKTAPKTAAPAAAAAEVDGEEISNAAINAVAGILEKNPKGVVKTLLRTGTFKAVTESHGAEMANMVIEAFFSSDDDLNGLLGQFDYQIVGMQIKPKA